MLTHARYSPHSGIAIGPILFVIAILAILAAVIAATSQMFTGGTTQENAKTMAQFIIDWCNNIDNAVQKIKLDGGYTDAQISFETPSGELTIDATGGNYYALTINSLCTVDACKVFKPAGGAVTPTAWPISVFSSLNDVMFLLGNNYGILSSCTTSINAVCRYPIIAGWEPVAVEGVNLNMTTLAASNLVTGIAMAAIDKNVCIQVNNLVGVQNPNGAPPVATFTNGYPQEPLAGQVSYNFALSPDSSWRGYYFQYFWGSAIKGQKTFCVFDSYYVRYLVVHLFM